VNSGAILTTFMMLDDDYDHLEQNDRQVNLYKLILQFPERLISS